jgi:murein L,D-transpeptidase YcbB/YkuD
LAEPAAPLWPDLAPVQQAEPVPPAPIPAQQAETAQPPAAPAPVVIESTAQPQPSPVAQVLRELFAAIESQPVPRDVRGRAVRDDMKAIGDFYAARDFAPVWRTGEDWAPSAASALSRLQKAGEDALDASAWRLPALSVSDVQSIAAADLALSHAVVTYGRQASGGRINPQTISRLITVKPETASVQEVLGKVSAAGGNAGDVLQGFNPPHPGYRALRAKLAEIRGSKPAPQETPVAIGPGPVLRVGMSDQRVPLIRARFGLTPNEPTTDPLVYDTKVAGAVAEFQRSKGMRANGELNSQTVNALSRNTNTAAPIEGDIISNMERWRWLPRDLGKMHILVNIPEFMVRVFDDGQRIHETRVIVGATKTPSPIFSHRMQHLVVNPSWHVPASIIRESGGAERMAAKGFEVRQTKHGVAVRQPPGPRNALGYVKFMFPNDHAVYLHDTPGRHLFSASMRAMSHGCIRVHEPFKLAEVVMSTEPGWSEKRLKGMIGSGERTIHLPKHLPIHLAYFTTYVDENGQLQQRSDIYGHSRRLMNALGIKG